MVIKENDTKHIYQLLEGVCDPEIPVLTIMDLGIVRDVKLHDSEIEVIITPTYTGCPAMDMISFEIKSHLFAHGFTNVKITTVLSPAWSTDWITEAGKRKLESYGIAAPNRITKDIDAPKECPLCHSTNTKLISQFGSTACKALYQCETCKEPFDYFKCH